MAGEPVCFVDGKHKGKSGVYVRRTDKRICATIDDESTGQEKFLAPKNVRPLGHPDFDAQVMNRVSSATPQIAEEATFGFISF